MIDVKEAVEKAHEYLRSLYGEDAAGVQLEEVELTEDERYWIVTLSYSAPTRLLLTVSTKYKQFRIDAQTGRVSSMKIRKV